MFATFDPSSSRKLFSFAENQTSGTSYNQLTIVIYDSIGVLTVKCYYSRFINYDLRVLYKIGHRVAPSGTD